MNAPTKVICSNCGYATNEDVVEGGPTTKVGRCCVNLPAPYEYDRNTGTYTVGDGYGAVAEDDHADDECSCENCEFERRWEACELDPTELASNDGLREYILHVRTQLGSCAHLGELESALEDRER